MGKLTEKNINKLKERIIDTINNSNLNKINTHLSSINDPILITGAGGSNVACEFARKVLEEKNNCFVKILDPRDLKYINKKNYKNIMSVSYSGNNFGVKLTFENNLNKYILTNNKKKYDNVTSIIYNNTIEKEKSFISLASTLMPITILLNYYLDNKNILKIIDIAFKNVKKINLPDKKNITIIYGNESVTTAKFLETTFIEAGIANVMLCTKYNYCHGQTTLPYHIKNQDLIFLKTSENELDQVILKETESLYNKVIVIESNYKDNVVTDFNLLIQSVYFIYEISKKYKKDLSEVKYAPAVKKLYYFEGSI